MHYVSKLSALDTGERDVEKVRGELRELQLRQTGLQVRPKLQQEIIERLEGENKILVLRRTNTKSHRYI